MDDSSLHRRRALRGLCRALLSLGYLALALWLMAFPLLWIVRDGLGPDSVETTGWAALKKCSPMLLVGLALATCVALLHRCTGRQQDEGREAKGD